MGANKMNTLYGLLGYPLGHSLSPPLHQFLLEKMNKPGGYHLFPVEDKNLAPALLGLELLSTVGVNVTIPHKQAVLSFMDEVSPQARAIGAINTIHYDRGLRTGHNTDYAGFGYLLKRFGFCPSDKKVAILGAGGSALAVAHYLADHKAKELTIFSRSAEKNSHGGFSVSPYEALPEKLKQIDLLVNCTPVGMHPRTEEMPLTLDLLANFSGAVVDLIYNPLTTRLTCEAAKLGLPAINGLSMLVGQGVAAQEIWQGHSLDPSWGEEAEQFLTKVLNESL